MPIDFPANPTNGQVFSNWIYDSSITSWRNVNTDTGVAALNTMGLRNVVPTSIQVGTGSATVNANGTVSFSGATSISLNNVFTSTYTNYYVNISISSSSASSTLNWRMRSSGADNTGSFYYTGGTFARITGTTGSFATNGTNSGFFSWLNGEAYVSLNLANPALPVRTNGYSNALANDGASLAGISCGQSHFVTTAYDGITIFPGTGNMTGTIQVFGYTN
jgi:hypothetical protein